MLCARLEPALWQMPARNAVLTVRLSCVTATLFDFCVLAQGHNSKPGGTSFIVSAIDCIFDAVACTGVSHMLHMHIVCFLDLEYGMESHDAFVQ